MAENVMRQERSAEQDPSKIRYSEVFCRDTIDSNIRIGASALK